MAASLKQKHQENHGKKKSSSLLLNGCTRVIGEQQIISLL
jgi:hypothetical protein